MMGETSGSGMSEEALKANIWVRLLGPKMEPSGFQLTQAIHLYGAFPLNTPDSPLDYSTGSQVFIDVSFTYDYWRYELWPF